MPFLILSLAITLVLGVMFFFLSHSNKFENSMMSSFECGFSTYFFSRYCFSMHYYMVGLIFLFLDLEICVMLPFFNESFSSFYIYLLLMIFISVMIGGVLLEWSMGKLEWKF